MNWRGLIRSAGTSVGLMISLVICRRIRRNCTPVVGGSSTARIVRLVMLPVGVMTAPAAPGLPGGGTSRNGKGQPGADYGRG